MAGALSIGDWVALGDQAGRIKSLDATGKCAVTLLAQDKTLWRAAGDVVPLFGRSANPKPLPLEVGDWVHVSVKTGEAAVVGQIARVDNQRVNVHLTDGRVLWRSWADVTPPSDDAPRTVLLEGPSSAAGARTPPPSRPTATSTPTPPKAPAPPAETDADANSTPWGVNLRMTASSEEAGSFAENAGAPAGAPAASDSLASRISLRRQQRSEERSALYSFASYGSQGPLVPSNDDPLCRLCGSRVAKVERWDAHACGVATRMAAFARWQDPATGFAVLHVSCGGCFKCGSKTEYL